jgi:hypothetical protein
MGMGPIHQYVRTPAQEQQQQQQGYMNQFNNAQYAAIPGVRGPQQAPPSSYTYTWNGQQRTYDPSQPAPQPTGWGRGMSSLLGQVMPGVRSQWMNENLSNEDWQTFLPPNQANQAMQPGTAQNHMMQLAPPAAMSGRYGQQAAALAGLLGNQGPGATGGGLLGGGKRGFRVPGGGK